MINADDYYGKERTYEDPGNGIQLKRKSAVQSFRHFLMKIGAVNDSDCVDIDTGALIFSTEMMESLYSLIAAPEDYDRHVNAKTRLSLDIFHLFLIGDLL